jgi:hypothetical protein
MAPSSTESMEATVKASPRFATYSTVVDRESAREILAKKLEEGAKAQAEDERAEDRSAADKARSGPKSSGRGVRKDDGGGVGEVVSDVVKSSAFKQFMRTAAAEIARGMFGTARRRR